MSKELLRIEGLSCSYKRARREVRAVKDVDIMVARGEMVMIQGPSGAGKSTLLEAMGGLLQPVEGRVLYGGKDIYRLAPRKRARIRRENTGFVFQFYHLLPELNLIENVMLPGLIAGRGFRGMRKRSREMLSEVGLADRQRHRPGEVSGGEAQRAAVARALVNGPEVLFCDEPTGNLDTRTGDEVWSLIERLSRERGMSVVAVSHDRASEVRFNTRYRMVDGVVEKADMT